MRQLQAPVPPQLTDSFGADQPGQPFEPAAGDRILPTPPGPGSPWWKEGAATDPWRDALSPYWIAGPPVFADDQVIGIGDPPEPVEEEPPEPGRRGRARFGLSALAIVLVAGLVAGVVGGGVGYWLSERAHRVLTDPERQAGHHRHPGEPAAGFGGRHRQAGQPGGGVDRRPNGRRGRLRIPA